MDGSEDANGPSLRPGWRRCEPNGFTLSVLLRGLDDHCGSFVRSWNGPLWQRQKR